jgi:hypothetical protein
MSRTSSANSIPDAPQNSHVNSTSSGTRHTFLEPSTTGELCRVGEGGREGESSRAALYACRVFVMYSMEARMPLPTPCGSAMYTHGEASKGSLVGRGGEEGSVLGSGAGEEGETTRRLAGRCHRMALDVSASSSHSWTLLGRFGLRNRPRPFIHSSRVSRK